MPGNRRVGKPMLDFSAASLRRRPAPTLGHEQHDLAGAAAGFDLAMGAGRLRERKRLPDVKAKLALCIEIDELGEPGGGALAGHPADAKLPIGFESVNRADAVLVLDQLRRGHKPGAAQRNSTNV